MKHNLIKQCHKYQLCVWEKIDQQGDQVIIKCRRCGITRTISSNNDKYTKPFGIMEICGKRKRTEELLKQANAVVALPSLRYKLLQQFKNVVNTLKRYIKARSQWKKAKEPLRSPEEIIYIYDEICSKCKNFKTSTHWFMRIFKFLRHSCSICGCRLKRKGRRLNKIAWLTEQCPDHPPKWLANVPNMKEYLEKNPPKKGGCGCASKK